VEEAGEGVSEQRIRLRREVPFGLIEFEQDPPQDNGYQHRAYYVTVDSKRKRMVSVTTFLRVLDKPALVRWKEDTGIRNAIAAERSGLLKDIALDDVAGILRDNKMGSEAALATATTRGLDIHKLLEDFATKGAVPSPAAFPPEHKGYVRNLVAWLLSATDRGLEIESTEQLVAHPRLGYAGRYDLRARLGGFSYLIDLKTNRHGRVWADHHYQPVAYAHAAIECGEEPPHQCLIVAVGPDSHEEMIARVGPADVKAVLDCYRRVQKLDAAIRSERERMAA
jgi:hypothetical protein